jgi:hypothetical protein
VPKIGQIRGMLLEEALLHLLRGSGYRTVEAVDNDETLKAGAAGLLVRGRGGNHQIDAIADFLVSQPFSHPQRLLVEAKCYSNKVRLPVVRNAVGVLKDVSEYWVPSLANVPAKRRYHYQYALFSASGYTKDSERYAFAQDINLIPLANSTFLRPVLDAIRSVSEQDFGNALGDNMALRISSLRRAIRNKLKSVDYSEGSSLPDRPLLRERLNQFVVACHQINYAIIATLQGGFPVFLVPNPEVSVDSLLSSLDVRIFWDSAGWYLRNRNGQELFSFDLPPALFLLYAQRGILSRRRALDLKEQAMSEFQAICTRRGEVRIITFHLDEGWLVDVRERLERHIRIEGDGPQSQRSSEWH